jgi:hypothetical protein
MSDAEAFAPNVKDGPVPLETLIMSAIRRFGDYHPDTIDGDTVLMMIEFANEILEEIRNHPYWDATVLDDYISSTDAREVPDRIMIAGLQAKYAEQQASEKMQVLMGNYYRTMNQTLWRRLNATHTDGGGDRSPPLQIRPMDSPIHQSVITGQQKEVE